MTNEEIEKNLEKARVKNGKRLVKAEIAKKPKDVQGVLRGLNGLDSQTGRSLAWEKEAVVRAKAVAELEGVTKKKRIEIFEVLMGPIAEEAELAWQWLGGQPYPRGYSRKSFRAPRNRDVQRELRGDWLRSMQSTVEDYRQDLAWYLEWGEHLYCAEGLSVMMAALIDAGDERGERVLSEVLAAANGEKGATAIGGYVLPTLMKCGREEAWEAVEKLLLAAQRQEGLRQAIFEGVDEAHPEAFRRMLRLMLDENLLRFSSAARAIDVWFGLEWDARSVKEFRRILELVVGYLGDQKKQEEGIKSEDAEEVYFSLWSMGFEDVEPMMEKAKKLLENESAEHRFVGVTLLAQTQKLEGRKALVKSLGDENLTVAARAYQAVRGDYYEEIIFAYKELRGFLERLPDRKDASLKPLVWPWTEGTLAPSEIADALVSHLETRNPLGLFEVVSRMSPSGRSCLVEPLAEWGKKDKECRKKLLEMLKDRSSGVVASVFRELRKGGYKGGEEEFLESLLSKKSAELRRGALELLLKQKDEQVLASVERLLGEKLTLSRQGGLELLDQLAKEERVTDKAREMAAEYRERRKKLSKTEEILLEGLVTEGSEIWTLEDALGLAKECELTKAPVMTDLGMPLITGAGVRLVAALDELIHEHRKEEISFQGWNGEEMCEPLGSIAFGFPAPEEKLDREANLARLPLATAWLEWWEKRGDELRDEDGFELLRARVVPKAGEGSYYANRSKKYYGWSEKDSWNGLTIETPRKGGVRYETVLDKILEWIFYLFGNEREMLVGALDSYETALAGYAREELCEQGFRKKKKGKEPSQHSSPWQDWRSSVISFSRGQLSVWDDELRKRFWEMEYWKWRPVLEVSGEQKEVPLGPWGEEVDCHLALNAYEAGFAKVEDVYFRFLGFGPIRIPKNERPEQEYYSHYGEETEPEADLSDIRVLGEKSLRGRERLADVIATIRDRVLEVELGRGDLPTVSSTAALSLWRVEGIDRFFELAEALGKENLIRTYSWGEAQLSRNTVFSHLLRICHAKDDETFERFNTLAMKSGLSDQRFLDLAVFAPQWANWVEGYLGWSKLEDAIWWIHAHTKDTQWEVDEETREAWETESRERTPLSGEDLQDGAVDVGWFSECYLELKKKRWEMLYRSAKMASSSAGHRRAQLFADAMLGTVTKTELTKRIKEKRNQDAVRALGLLPLAGGKGKKRDLLLRYELFQEFLRGSKKFGSQRQASEKRAMRIGMDNLARTAGYADPVRLEWAMEQEAVEDLKEGSISVEVGETIVTLLINEWCEPEIKVEKGGKQLKSVPVAAKKDKAVKALTGRKTELKRQLSRMRKSLEGMMCDGIEMEGRELKELMEHPLLAPLLGSLVFWGEEGLRGYPEENGKVLRSADGKLEPVTDGDILRIAHPDDLFQSKGWSQWQGDCFSREVVQPFKQVFREYYPVSDAEAQDKRGDSKRFAGHQVNPRQAMALLGARGWVAVPEEGVRKVFYREKFCSWLSFEESFHTPAEVEGLTLEGVHFTPRGEDKRHELAEIPRRLFSEVMRDMDLVVSVAHMGGVDPEASQSTMEMRGALIAETARLMGLKNVELKERNVFVKGELGEYSIHLGSAETKMVPGGSLFLVAVQSQHRGRIFLPFADDDPKTAELLSKVILLARDHEIKDPKLLRQIQAGR